jgi:hypothetical protein
MGKVLGAATVNGVGTVTVTDVETTLAAVAGAVMEIAMPAGMGVIIGAVMAAVPEERPPCRRR